MLEDEQIEDFNPIIEKPSLADRIQRDAAARKRRKEVKLARTLHSYKEEKEARERLKAKRRLIKNRKRAKTA